MTEGRPWHFQPASELQRQIARALGLALDPGATRGEAAKAIDAEMTRRSRAMAGKRQLGRLADEA